MVKPISLAACFLSLLRLPYGSFLQEAYNS
jgi:hypothetical protein